MPLSSDESFQFAKELCAQIADSDNRSEAISRAVVSRAYYAAFYKAYEVWEAHDKGAAAPSAEGVHQQLLSNLKHCAVELGGSDGQFLRSAVDQLARLKARRTDADYRLQKIIGEQDAKDAVQLAGQIVRRLTACFPNGSSME